MLQGEDRRRRHDRAITQFFFDNEVFFRYLDRVRERRHHHPHRARHHPDP